MKRNRFAASMVAVSLFGLVAIGTLGACSETSGPATQGRDAAQVAQDQAFGKGYTSPGYDGPAPVSPPFGLTHYEEGSGGVLAISFGSKTVSGSGGVLSDALLTDEQKAGIADSGSVRADYVHPGWVYSELGSQLVAPDTGNSLFPAGPGYIAFADGRAMVYSINRDGRMTMEALPAIGLRDASVKTRGYYLMPSNVFVPTPDASNDYSDLIARVSALKAAAAGASK